MLLVALTLNFLLPRLMPGSPLGNLAGEDAGQLSSQERLQLIHDAGLDKSLFEQYLTYASNLVRGDLGYSYQRKQPVTRVLLERLPWTLLLSGTALVLATCVGITAGAIAGWRHGRRVDRAALATFILLESVPAFWLGMLLIALFAGVLPTFGARSIVASQSPAVDVAQHLVLPLATLTLVTASSTFLTLRASLITVIGEPFITVARAKGLHESAILSRHALRNALLPLATIVLLNIAQVVAGATIVETVFSYPGLGRLLYESVLARDYPLLQGGFLLITLCVLLANFVADALYPLLDPRVTRHA